MVLLETPHRLIDSLADFLEIFDDRDVVVAREMTKLHEEIFRGSISAALDHFEQGKIKGEITLVIAGSNAESSKWSRKQLLQEIECELQSSPPSPSRLAKDLAEQSGWPRSEVYQLILDQSQNNK
jgi:16S rRNA (cytidine1402-2'-O)-methyltransferase